ncbi:MAG TPA: serine hydrolase [Allosphingosinicella sp.]|nr:serine hydrolase [Allosphingosinicella sp.]
MVRRLLFMMLALLAVPAAAQPPSPALRNGGERVVALLKGEAAPAEIFTPAFLAEVPEPQVRAITAQFAAQYGAVRGLARIDAASAQSGTIHVDYERAIVHFSLAVEAQPPLRISGLLLTGADMRGDSMDAVLAEIRALPGQASVAVARLGGPAPVVTAGVAPDRALAIGSAFKLWILAELSRQVRAGERRWSDVVPIDRRSIPGGTLYGWPQGAPVTLHTLASLMISISDNSATDVLLHVVGRENVERMMARIGVAAAARNRPLLSTLELSAIKTGPDAARDRWLRAGEAERRRILATDYAGLDPASVDISRFTGAPLYIDSVEWFASPANLARTMDWLRVNGDDVARAILAINPGLAARIQGAFAYVGYKGGSEPGVVSLSWLVRNRAGGWFAVSGIWNNPAGAADPVGFAGLMARAVQLLR